MMNVLLKCVRTLSLNRPEVEKFLLRAARLVIIGEITNDDWQYLTRLVVFRVNKYVLNK